MDALAPNRQDGGGVLRPMLADSYTASDPWLEPPSIGDGMDCLVLYPPEAEADTFCLDLFITTHLSPNVPGLKLTNWAWVLRTDPGETNLIVPDLWDDQAWFRLGRTIRLHETGSEMPPSTSCSTCPWTRWWGR
jgi:hypothetical protein